MFSISFVISSASKFIQRYRKYSVCVNICVRHYAVSFVTAVETIYSKDFWIMYHIFPYIRQLRQPKASHRYKLHRLSHKKKQQQHIIHIWFSFRSISMLWWNTYKDNSSYTRLHHLQHELSFPIQQHLTTKYN